MAPPPEPGHDGKASLGELHGHRQVQLEHLTPVVRGGVWVLASRRAPSPSVVHHDLGTAQLLRSPQECLAVIRTEDISAQGHCPPRSLGCIEPRAHIVSQARVNIDDQDHGTAIRQVLRDDFSHAGTRTSHNRHTTGNVHGHRT